MIITNEINTQFCLKWAVTDGEWAYMDTYYFTEEEYKNLTPEELLERQTKQYEDWKAYCENPSE
jgi:hypothetical protein